MTIPDGVARRNGAQPAVEPDNGADGSDVDSMETRGASQR